MRNKQTSAPEGLCNIMDFCLGHVGSIKFHKTCTINSLAPLEHNVMNFSVQAIMSSQQQPILVA